MNERTVYLYIDTELCRACTPCLASRTCRQKAIMQIDPGEPPFLDIDRCRDCRVCIPACPHGALCKLPLNGSRA